MYGGTQMFKVMKMSKYNYTTYDHEGNLILYNFLTGLQSLTKVMKPDIDKFAQLFLTDAEIHSTSCEEYTEVISCMLKSGILVASDTDENVLYDSTHYNEAFDSRLTLTILPTGKCNFSCPYCYEAPQSFCREAMALDAQNAILKFVQKKIPSHRALHVAWFGGEPLLEPEIIKYLSNKFIQICNARLLTYSAEITTNGFFLDAEMFDMLYKLKVYNYMITIDGFKEQHDKLRFTNSGIGSYDVILGNLLWIRDNKQYKFAHIVVRINVSRNVLDMLDDFVCFILSSFSDDPRFEIKFVSVINFSDSKSLDSDIFVGVNELFLYLQKNEMYMNKLFSDELRISQIVPEKKCAAALKNSYVITPDLNIHKCYVHFDQDTNKIGQISFKGDLLLDEALHRRWFLKNKFINRMPETCNNCFYLPCCYHSSPGCPVRYNETMSDDSCTIIDEKRMEHLNDTVLYAALKYMCITLVL